MAKRTTTEAFNEFDENLKLDPNERALAEKMHNDITDLLRAAGIVTYAFLQGSFARKTMIAPLRDVDKIVVLTEAMRTLTPDQVMDRIQAVIADAYPYVTFDRSRHALQVDFGSDSFYFDMVPAWETTTDDDDVLIANRDTGGWDRSNTRELIRVVATRNGDTNGRFIHEVRMGKQGVKHLLDGLVPGLHVESWAYMAVTAAMAHDEALARIFETGAQLLGRTYTDPTGVDVISKRLKPGVIATAKPVFQMAAADARQARQLTDAGDHEAAIAIWFNILGVCFPAPDDQAAIRSSFAPGAAITAAGAVSRAGQGAQRTQPVRPWRPR
jgi:hypothetical protein